MSPIAIRATVGAGLALALMSCAAHRPEPVHIGQQDVRSPRPKVERPTPATIEPQTGTGLETLVRLDIPTGLPNVEAGALYVLRGSGYTFASYCAHCPAKAGLIAKEPISPLAYTGGITTVRRALLLIAGSHSKLVVDDRAKVVTFDEYTGS